LPVQERIGIHLGEVVIKEHETEAKAKDLYGLQVVTCARVMSLAQGGQILLTRGGFDSARQVLKGEDLAGVGPLSWVSHGPYLLKGIEEAVEVCEVGEAGQSPLAAPKTSEKAQRQVRPDEEPVLGWRPAVGQQVPNTQWVLEKKLGEGGFGEVWLGRHEKLKERRVFKFCFRADRVRSLKREMTLFRLIKERIGDHPNIVRLLEVYFEEPPFYVVMDHVEGQDLKAWCEQQGGAAKVPLETRLEIAAQIADALQAAHDAGVIHRDVKPGNILVSGVAANWRSPHSSPSGSAPPTLSEETPQPEKSSANASSPLRVLAKLTDFGIGQVVSEEYLKGVTRAGFTQTMLGSSTSSQTGTQLYMAPELWAGKPASTRSDIYSLGVVLYQLLVGDFARPVATDWGKDVADPLLREDLQHCFAGKPEDRFAGVGQLATNLRSLEARRAVLAERERLNRKAARRRMITLISAGATAVLLLLAIALGYGLHRAKAEALTAHRNLYVADINLAQYALQDGKIDRALELLEAHRPEPGQADLRGFEWRFLRQFCHGDELFSLQVPGSVPRSIARSPDGSLLASGETSRSPSVRIWDVAKRTLNFSLRIVGPYVRSVAYSRDGKLLAASDSSGFVRLWDTTTWQEWATLPRESNWVERVAISPDGRLLAAATRGDVLARLWSLETKAVLATFTGPAYERACVTFSPDGRWLAFGRGDRTVKLIEVQTRKAAATLPGHQNVVTYLDFSPDSRTLACADSDGTVKLWEVATRREIGVLVGHKAHVSSVTFSPDGRSLATSCADCSIKLWDFASRQELATFHGHSQWANAAIFFPDGKTLASCSDDGTIKFWDVGAKRQDPILGGATNMVDSMDVSPDGKLIATGQKDGIITLWEVASQKIQGTLRAAVGTSVRCCVFSPNGKALLTASDDGKVILWDLASRKEVRTLDEHEGVVRNAVFSRDGHRLATLSGGTTVKLWEVATGKGIGTLQGQGEDLRFLAPAPDGRIFVLGEADNIFRLHDVANPQVVVTCTGAGNPFYAPAFSPDFKLMAGGDAKGNLFVWDTATGDRVGPRSGHTANLRFCAFSADGKLLVSTSNDRTAKLWDVARWREIATLRGHSGWVSSAAFSPDGKTLATAGCDGTAKLWSLVSYRELLTLPDRVAPYGQVRFTRDGSALLCGGEDRLVRLWRAPSWAEIAAAEQAQAGGKPAPQSK
jgi:WD40 repeat protein